MFSIIIPVYNKAPYVAKAIQSVLDQTYQEFELIVVDDGSTDNSLEVIKSLSLSTFNFQLSTQVNSGVSTARNNGVAQAKYDYICFLDADDWWEPTFLEEMKSLMDEFPDAGIYGTNYYIVKNGNNRVAPVGVERGFLKGLINYCQVYSKTLCMPLWTGSVCIPKEMFNKQNGFKPQLKLGEDFDLWIRIAMEHVVAFLNKPLAYYNQDVDMQNRGVVDEKIYEKSTFFTFNLGFLEGHEQINKDLKILLDRLRVYSLLRFRIQGAYKQEVDEIISKVDFSNVDKKFYRYYFYPLIIVRIWLKIKKYLSKLKIKIKSIV